MVQFFRPSAPHLTTSAYTTRVRWLRRVLPIGAVLGILVVLLWTSFESFFEKKIEGIPTQLKTQITQNTLVNPRIQSTDASGKPFTIQAKSATHAQNTPETIVEKPIAEIDHQDGNKITVTSDTGQLNQETQKFLYQDNVHLKTSQGFDFITKRALVDLKTQTVTSSDPLEGTAPFGTLASQEGFEASKQTQTLFFKGPTTLVIEPKILMSDNPVENSNNPLTIFSPTGIVCAHKDQTCTATGPVTASKEAMILRCQRLVLTVKNGANTPQNRIDKIEAFTNVVLTDSKEGLTATGNHALYDPQHEHIYLEGNPILKDKDTVLKGCSAIIFKKNDGIALTKGRGTMLYKDKLLQADTFTVYVKTSVEGKMTLDRVKAEGHVILSTAQEIAKSDTGLYQAGTQLVELFGNVSLTRPEGQLQGTYARYDMVTGQSQLFNKTPAGKNARVQGILIPKHVKKNGL